MLDSTGNGSGGGGERGGGGLNENTNFEELLRLSYFVIKF